MRPHLAKLTITQHNFNPTVFLGGGAYILSLGLTLPDFFKTQYFWTQMNQTLFLTEILWPKILLTKKYVWQINLSKFFLTKILWPKIFSDRKFIFDRNFFDLEFLLNEIFLTQLILYPKFYEIFFDQKCFLTEYFVRFKKKKNFFYNFFFYQT